MEMVKSENELKKTLYHIYNAISKEIYGYGAIELKIYHVENLIVFTTKDNRVRILQILEKENELLKKSVDNVLFQAFKGKLKEALEQELKVTSTVLFRDYDSDSQIAVTVVMLNQKIMK